MQFPQEIAQQWVDFFHSVQHSDIRSLIILGVLLIASGVILSAGVEMHVRFNELQDKGKRYTLIALTLGSFLLSLAEQTLPFVQNGWFPTTFFGSIVVAILLYAVRLKKTWEGVAATYNDLVEIGNKRKAASVPATVNGSIFDEGVQS